MDEFQAKTAAFMAWLRQRTGTRISPKIQIADLRDHDAGRGIVATADIGEDEELFTVSQSEVLTVQTSSLQRFKPGILERLDSWSSLVLVMIYEDGQGQESAWSSYLQILPTKFDTLIYWSPAEIAELEGSAVLNKIGKNDAENSFSKTLLPIVQQYSDIFGRYAQAFSGVDAEVVLLALAHRMATLIMAYGFDLEAEPSSEEEEEEEEEEEDVDGSSQSAYELRKGMVPLADLFNADGDLNNAHLLQHGNSMTMIVLKDIASGQQIFNDFGQLPRSDLLRRYGYITDRYKRWDVVEVDIKTITQATAEHNNLTDRERDQRLELAVAWEVLNDGYDLVRSLENAAFEFDQALLLTITALLLDSEGFEQAMEEPPEQPPSSMLETVCLIICKILVSRQNAYKTTIAEDCGLLDDTTVQGRRRMAVEVRLGEKEILAMAAARIYEELNRLRQGIDENEITSRLKRRKL